MASEDKTNNGLLYTISEGLQGGPQSDSPSSIKGEEPHQQKDRQHLEGETESGAGTPDTASIPGSPMLGHEDTRPNGPKKSHPRLAQLRDQIRAQVSIEYPSPGHRMMELVDKARRKDLEDASSMDGSLTDEGHTACHCQVILPNGLSADIDRRLQLEMAALRGEMRASLELMKKELTGELNALRTEMKTHNKNHPKKSTDVNQLNDHGDKKPDQWKNVFRKVNRKDEQGGKAPAKIEAQFKARSVPSLGTQQAPSRNQVLLRAMTTISAKNALIATMGQRSLSDPLDAPDGKVTHPPLQNGKPPVRASEPPLTSKPSAKWNKKINNQTVAPHPPIGGAPTAKAH